ncbi:PREDICTED: C-X-C chemokine receptor type 5 [Poecilia mexicana]|uniref:C-X-C motif chemokine receptor 5 n=2 Tax=Poecilia TaxID=8080 RepID=A0A087YRE7_POEFO|nr:PREDICTED: C-X-C chemokine receptor type 5 [Poecilia formosa]XP_014865318.1 PREDICTED: C-X-C chemokine receptor type 5 [Poecilia mexicana]
MAFTKTYTGGMDTDYEYYSYDNNTDNKEDFTCDNEVLVFQDFYSVFSPVLNSLIFLLGLVGNGLMVTILLKRHRRLRITEIYLLHLALADLILIFTLPFNVVESVAGWLFGEFFCMLYGVLRNMYLLCGSFLLACIGFDRYLAIVHAIPSMQSRRPKRVHLTCASLWLICFLLSLPNAVFLSVKSEKNDSLLECDYYRYEINAQNWVLANRFLHHVTFFFSLAVMCYCYTALVITLFKSQKSQAKKGAIRLALLVTIVFCVCWLPNNITSLMKTLAELEVVTSDTCWPKQVLAQAHTVTESLGVSHCCLNPFLYAFVGVQFRNELLHLLCRLGCSRFCLRFIKAQNYGRPSVSDGTTSNSMVMY